jgi:hypothetical protein
VSDRQIDAGLAYADHRGFRQAVIADHAIELFEPCNLVQAERAVLATVARAIRRWPSRSPPWRRKFARYCWRGSGR